MTKTNAAEVAICEVMPILQPYHQEPTQSQGHLAKLAQCSELLGYLIPDALCVGTYSSMAPIYICNTSKLYLRTQRSDRVTDPSWVSFPARRR